MRAGHQFQKEYDGNKAYLNFNNNQDSSDDDSNSDDKMGQTVRQIVQKAKNEKIRFGTVFKENIYDIAGPVILVALNEKQKENNFNATIEDASQLFSKDLNF